MPESADALAELDLMIGVVILGACKMIAEETGESCGQMACPRCTTGSLRWSVASNGHGLAACSRKIELADGRTVRCVNVME